MPGMVLPWRDDNPTRRTPVVTWVLIAINVVVFLLSPAATTPFGTTTGTELCSQVRYYQHWGAVPKEIFTGTHVITRTRYSEGGVVYSCPVDTRPKSPVLGVLTSLFVHGGWLHLLGNMLFLWVFGNNVEDRFGRLRFLLFYLGCGVAATFGHAALSTGSTEPLVGASGAIAGVLGAYLVMFPRVRVLSSLTFFFFLPVRLPAWLVLGGWFVLQYAYFRGTGVSSGAGVAYGAHVVGFVVGLLFALLVRRERPERPQDHAQYT
jgi:membrane associated rhomboid family serine protease